MMEAMVVVAGYLACLSSSPGLGSSARPLISALLSFHPPGQRLFISQSFAGKLK